jgi:3-carboxy-cis,cis-muconate cycloisomerase
MAPFGDVAHLQALLDVEVALAVAEAHVGVIPSSCVDDIRAAARVDLYDLGHLRKEAVRAGNIVIPLVAQLTDNVAARNQESARYVHYGATSQDILDTARLLQLRVAIPPLQDRLRDGIASAAALARTFSATPMVGRTLLQAASPTTFGLKAAGWLDTIARCRERIGDACDQSMVVQFGGASGTLAPLGDRGPAVAKALAEALSLHLPELPWHTHRDRLVNLAAALGIACGALGKVGRDLTLLAQTEVREAVEIPGSGRGASSSMPHKQNPVRAITAVSAAIRAPGLVATMLAAMPQEHERAAGGWHAEWPTLPELVQLTTEAGEAIAGALADLVVDATRMSANLAMGGGGAMAESLAIALGQHVARRDAMRIVARVSRAAERDGINLRDAADRDPEVHQRLSPADLERAMQPENFLGSANVFVERVLQRWGV